MKGSSSLVAGLLAVALGGGCSVFSTPDVPLLNPKRYQVSGTISGAVVAGVTVKLSGAESASTTTDAQGKYSFGPVGNGLFSVAPVLGGYVFQPPSTAVTVEGADVGGKDFVATATTLPTHRIAGTVSGAVAAGVTITLSGPGSPSTVTDGTGAFGFEGLVDGEYTLTPSASGFGFYPAALPVTLSGVDVSGADFAASALDRTPPQVVSQTPAPGDGNVWVKAPIQVTFDEPIRLPLDSAVSVSGAGSLALVKTLSLSGDGKTLTIALPSPPTAPNTITVTLGSGITDLAGNALVGASWSFSMPVWWSPWPNPLDFGTAASYGTSLVLGPNGEPILAQCIVSGQRTSVLVQRWNGNKWDRLGEPLGIQASTQQPILVTDSSGRLFVAWSEQTMDSAFSQVFVAKWDGNAWVSPDGSALSATQGVSSNTSGHGANPALALRNGIPVIAWTESTTVQVRTGVSSLVTNLFVKSWNNQGWSSLFGSTSLNVTPANAVRQVTMGADRNGNPIVAWTEAAPGSAGPDAFVKQWNGSQWTQLGTTINDPGETAGVISLVTDSTGTPIIAFDEQTSDTSVSNRVQHLFVKKWTGVWGAISPELNTSSSQSAGTATIALGADGNPVVVFSEDGATIRTYTASVTEYRNGSWANLAPWTSRFAGVPVFYSPRFVLAVSQGNPITGWNDDWFDSGVSHSDFHLAVYNR